MGRKLLDWVSVLLGKRVLLGEVILKLGEGLLHSLRNHEGHSDVTGLEGCWLISSEYVMLPGPGEGGMFQMELELRSPAVITESRGVRQTPVDSLSLVSWNPRMNNLGKVRTWQVPLPAKPVFFSGKMGLSTWVVF